jgi:parallel beta-helix repeat protein
MKENINKLSPIGVLIILFGAVVITSISANTTSNQKIMLINDDIYVDDDAVEPFLGTPEHPFKTINDGINNSTGGLTSTVWVYNGTYNEDVTIDKPLSLVALHEKGVGDNSPYNAIINGSGVGDVIKISYNDVNIIGFTIQNSGPSEWTGDGSNLHGGIGISDHTRITISNNRIINNSGNGINTYKIGEIIIHDNIIENNGKDGIAIYETILTNLDVQISIEHNSIKHNKFDGIYFYKTDSIKDPTNTLTLGDSQNYIINNCIINNSQHGIKLHRSSKNFIKHNLIENNLFQGINFYVNSKNNYINDNNIEENEEYGLYFDGMCQKNLMFQNNIINNGYNSLKHNAYFVDCFRNIYSQNYWEPRILPIKIVPGLLSISPPIPWSNYDSRPKDNPYSIILDCIE